MLAGLGGGCQQPLGALATLENGEVHLRAAYAGPDGFRRGEARGADDRTVLAAVLKEMGW